MLTVALAASAFGQETTIKVPRGSGVFPTVGQVDCLEELGSGRLCAATYECSEGSGELWGDLANHDGRRAIGEDSPIARGRDCTITIDGRAAVRWLTAWTPRGRDSELAGLTTQASTTQAEAASEPWTVSYTKSVESSDFRFHRLSGDERPRGVDIGVRWHYGTGNDTRTRDGTFRAALHCPPPFAPMEANTIRFTAGDSNTLTFNLNVSEDVDPLVYRPAYVGRDIYEVTYRCWLRVNARLDDEDSDQDPVEYSAYLPVDVTIRNPRP